MTLELRLLRGLRGVTKEGFSLAQDECGSSIAGLIGLLGRLEIELIDRIMETLTRNTSAGTVTFQLRLKAASLSAGSWPSY